MMGHLDVVLTQTTNAIIQGFSFNNPEHHKAIGSDISQVLSSQEFRSYYCRMESLIFNAKIPYRNDDICQTVSDIIKSNFKNNRLLDKVYSTFGEPNPDGSVDVAVYSSKNSQPIFEVVEKAPMLLEPSEIDFELQFLAYKHGTLFNVYNRQPNGFWYKKPQVKQIELNKITKMIAHTYRIDGLNFEYIQMYYDGKWETLGVMRASDMMTMFNELPCLGGVIAKIGDYKWVVYEITHKATGLYYRGKTSAYKWHYHDYMGSGDLIKKLFADENKNMALFNRRILRSFRTEDEAYDYEAEVVVTKFEDHMSLNLIPGGRGGGSTERSPVYGELDEDNQNSKSAVEYLADPKNESAVKSINKMLKNGGKLAVGFKSTLWEKTKLKVAMEEVCLAKGHRPRRKEFAELLLKDHDIEIKLNHIKPLMEEIIIETFSE